MIKQQTESIMGNWISTKERMPEENVEVLALINRTEKVVVFYGKGMFDSSYNKEINMWRSTIGDYTYPQCMITHFMYIPNIEL